MIVLSLFDGMSCGRVALDRIGRPPLLYFASEIDKHAIAVAVDNFPDTVCLGDITRWREWPVPWSEVDLVIGGSPCQGFSLVGKRLNFEDPRSRLFFQFVEIINHINAARTALGRPHVRFLLENVRMKKESLDTITHYLGVEPLFINSSLVSAQSRPRWYWFNWDAPLPTDKGVRLTDILQSPDEVPAEFIIGAGQAKRLATSSDVEKKFSVLDPDRAVAMTARQYANWKGTFVSVGAIRGREFVNKATVLGRRLDENLVRKDYDKNVPLTQVLEVRASNMEKSNCLTTVQKDSVLSNLPPGRYPDAFNVYADNFRYLTPIECERLQTLPDDYTRAATKTQRYRMLGNGWTVDVVAHILRSLPI